MEPTVELGKRIEMIREDLRLTIKDFIRPLGASPQAYNAWVKKGAIPQADVIINILGTWRVYNYEWLLFGKGSMKHIVDSMEVNEPITPYHKHKLVSTEDLKSILMGIIDKLDNL